MASILLIEDDPTIRFTVEMALSDEGYRVSTCDNGDDGLASALNLHPNLILLDLLLPGLDGRELLVRFREIDPITPIIVLTALSEDADKISCLNNGADDYVCKPFSIDELLARIRANLRKAENMRLESTPKQAIMQFGDLTIDTQHEQALIKGKPIYLKRREYELLLALAQNAGTIVKRRWLIEKVWNKNVSPSTNTVDAHIYNLRKALDNDSEYEFISTEYGRGYRLQAIPKQAQD